jgi:hypothetical protein
VKREEGGYNTGGTRPRRCFPRAGHYTLLLAHHNVVEALCTAQQHLSVRAALASRCMHASAWHSRSHSTRPACGVYTRGGLPTHPGARPVPAPSSGLWACSGAHTPRLRPYTLVPCLLLSCFCKYWAGYIALSIRDSTIPVFLIVLETHVFDRYLERLQVGALAPALALQAPTQPSSFRSAAVELCPGGHDGGYRRAFRRGTRAQFCAVQASTRARGRVVGTGASAKPIHSFANVLDHSTLCFG